MTQAETNHAVLQLIQTTCDDTLQIAQKMSDWGFGSTAKEIYGRLDKEMLLYKKAEELLNHVT
jgi:hypothetical protein